MEALGEATIYIFVRGQLSQRRISFREIYPEAILMVFICPRPPSYQNPRVMLQDEHVITYTRRDVQVGRGTAQANTPSPPADDQSPDQSPDALEASVPDATGDTPMMVENEVLEKQVGRPDDEEREIDGAEEEERGQRGQPEAGEAIGMVAEESEEEEEGACVAGDASEDQNDGDDEKSGDEICPVESNVSEPEEGDALDESSEPEPEVEVDPRAAPVSVQEGNEQSPPEVRRRVVCVAG